MSIELLRVLIYISSRKKKCGGNMSFKDDIPNYKTLTSKDYHMTDAPDDIWEKLEACAVRAAKEVGLKGIVNELNDLALKPPTNNWGDDWLVGDLSEAIWSIRQQVGKGKLYLLYDAFSICVQSGDLDVDEINELLEDCQSGYFLDGDPIFRRYQWATRESVEDLAEEIADAKKIIRKKSKFRQAVEHFEQAQKQFEDASNERARKNAVRDCASAMETIVKICGNANDIKIATKNLRSDEEWGKAEIVKDGDAIFNAIHRLYPDVRHGSTETSEMPLNEARYWVGRISAYVQYMVRQYKELKGIK